MEYEIIEDQLNPSDYRVEAINSQAEGEVYTAIFIGPDAKSRAEEYVGWKNFGRNPALSRAS